MLATERDSAARGRVAVYGIDLETILESTRPDWHRVGPDLEERLSENPEPPPASNVVPLRSVPAPVGDGSLWTTAQAHLHQSDPANYATWYHQLAEAGREGGRVILVAPTSFHGSYVATHLSAPLLAALRTVDPSVASVSVGS